MFIPVGLIARLIVGSAGDSHDSAMQERMRRAGEEADAANAAARLQELWAQCTGPSGCLLVIGHQRWSGCTLDGIPLVAPAESPTVGGYREGVDLLGPGPHGLLAVCPGRHVLQTRIGERAATYAFTLTPREAHFVRFDADTYSRYESHEEQAIFRRVSNGDVTLFDYSQHVAMPRVQGLLAKGSWEVLPACVAQMKVVLEAITAGDLTTASHQAQRAAAMVTGVPVADFGPVTSLVGFHAFDLVAKERHAHAWSFLQAGLSVLPEHPTLLAVQGELQLRAGARDEGAATLKKALVRLDSADAALGARVRALLAEP